MALTPTKPGIDLGIVTTHGDTMLPFYRDVLGLKVLREMPMPGGNGVMHQMACGDSVVKLVVLPAVAAETPKGGIQGANGYRYWTITVNNLSEVLQTVADAGHKVVVKEREIRPGVRIGMVEDPDGNWVEFLQVG